jgi:hypothetical protein
MTESPAARTPPAVHELLNAALAATAAQVECCTRMASVLEGKHWALLSRDLDGLRDACTRLREAAAQLQATDERRHQASDALARAAGIPPEQMCISAAIGLSDEVGKIRWARVKRDLGRAVRRVQMLNELNQQWLRDELAYVRFIRNVVEGECPAQTYDEECRKVVAGPHPALLSSAS